MRGGREIHVLSVDPAKALDYKPGTTVISGSAYFKKSTKFRVLSVSVYRDHAEVRAVKFHWIEDTKAGRWTLVAASLLVVLAYIFLSWRLYA